MSEAGSLARALDFLREADRLKSIVRRSRLSFDPERRENDAEHSWHLALFALVLASHAADAGLDLAHALRMVLVHDLVEIDAGDTFLYDAAGAATQAAREELAATRIFGLAGEPTATELRGAWREFEARLTPEARFARALDRAQPILQNLHTEGRSWREHGVTAREVRAKNAAIVAEGAPAVWAELDRRLVDAVERGWLAP